MTEYEIKNIRICYFKYRLNVNPELTFNGGFKILFFQKQLNLISVLPEVAGAVPSTKQVR